MKCAASSIYKTIEKEVEERTKRNFNIFAKRLFVCFAAAMLDRNLCPNTVDWVAKKAYRLMEAVRERRISFDDLEKQIWDEGKIGFHFENMHFNPVECKEVENIIAMHKSGLYDAETCIKKIEERIKAA